MIEHSDVFIEGQWVATEDGSVAQLEDPSREEVFAAASLAGPETMLRAVAAARRAFDDGQWTGLSPEERLGYLLDMSRYLRDHAERYGDLVVREVGLPVVYARGGFIGAAVHADYWEREWKHYPWVERRTGVSGVTVDISREPVGVVAAIVPWNAPASLSGSKLVPALLAGCTMVLKPAPLNALSLRAFGDAALHAGLPPGVLNVVPADAAASEVLARSSAIDKIAFTGSDRTGRSIAAAAAEHLARVTLELGGKSAGIVLPGAPLERLAATVPPAFTLNNGEACAAMTRLLVPRERQDEIAEAIAEEVDRLNVGDPSDPATDIGPLAFRAHYAQVLRKLDGAQSAGARLVTGGSRPASLSRGFYLAPTIYANVDPASELSQEEIFAPVLAIIPYDTVDEAIRIANDTSYGLSAAVFGSDEEETKKVSARLRAGSVHLNNGFTVDIGVPFGGFKASGYGREFGPEGLDAYVELKATFLDGQPYGR